MRYAVFDEATGSRTAVNPSQVITVVKVDERQTEIVLTNGAIVRVALSFETVLKQLSEAG